jgi:hypothetical protein
LDEITPRQQQTQRTLLDWLRVAPAEIALMWQTAPPRMSIPLPAI